MAKHATFKQMINAALGGAPVDGVQGNRATGGEFRLPLDRAAVIESEDVSQHGGERIISGVDWLIGDSLDSPILSRLGVVETLQTRGRLASGDMLPATSMQAESGSSAQISRYETYTIPAVPMEGDQVRWLQDLPHETGDKFPAGPSAGDLFQFDADAIVSAFDPQTGEALGVAAAGDWFRYHGGASRWELQPFRGGSLSRDETYRRTGSKWEFQGDMFAEHEYTLNKVIEAKSEISGQLLMQSDFAFDAVLEAHRRATADRLLLQVLAGDGKGHNLLGVASAPGIGGATYEADNRGSSGVFQDGEDAIEDAGARGQYTAWGAGVSLSTSARRVTIEPGSDRRSEEAGRISLTNTPIQRVGSGLAPTEGLCADWSLILQPILSEILVIIDRQTSPGMTILTTRLPCSSPLVTHPSTVFKLTQAPAGG